MIKKHKTLNIYRNIDFPAEYFVPSEHILSSRAVDSDVILHVAKPNKDRLGLGKRVTLDVFDTKKLTEDGIYVDKRPFGGAGSYIGSGDICYTLHINRMALEDPNIPVGQVYHSFNALILHTLLDLGIDAHIAAAEGKNTLDGVCVNLSGRSELVSPTGAKYVASVFKEDGLVISIAGVIMLSDAWTKIYDYIKAPNIKKVPYRPLNLPSEEVTDTLIKNISSIFLTKNIKYFNNLDYEKFSYLADKFKVM